MNIGESLIVGRMGNQPLPISDVSVSPQHVKITRTTSTDYQIEDLDSAKGVFVFGFRVQRKTIKDNTPFLLGGYKTSVQQLLHDPSKVDLAQIWNDYDKQKRIWERYSMLVNSIRMIVPVITIALTMVLGQNIAIQISVIVAITAVVMVATESLNKKKKIKIAELNLELQRVYLCPHCQKFLGFIPYKVLKAHRYCPNNTCGVPLP